MPDNTELQFVDTNILIYAYDVTSTEKHRRALALISELWDSGRGCLSVQVLQEFYVNLTQKIPHPLTPPEAVLIIEDYGQWRLHKPELKSVIEAIHIQQRNKISFWDAMIICSAREMGCQNIWTEDLHANQFYEGIKAVNPFMPD
ncbi:MAG TPA: PIN domain-containing protein [Dehalococcoidales bacterium]|nr:PIN domain-containing protein [Dehalococcoidales bacterium]